MNVLHFFKKQLIDIYCYAVYLLLRSIFIVTQYIYCYAVYLLLRSIFIVTQYIFTF